MEYWIWLSLLPYIGPVTANRLLEHFEDPSRVYRAKIPELIKVKGITERQMQSIAENKSLDRIREIMNSWCYCPPELTYFYFSCLSRV